MGKALALLLTAAFAAILNLTHARVAIDLLNDELDTELEIESDDKHPEPVPNKACHCENSYCSCCLVEFKKKICASLDFIEKVDEDTLLVRVNLTINDKEVLSQKISTNAIPAVCYRGITGLGACAKLNTRAEEVQYKLCTTLQILYGQKLLKEYELYCMKIHRTPKVNYADFFRDSDSIPPLCHEHGPLGVCVKLNVKKKEEVSVCTSLQLRFNKELEKEYDLYCLAIPLEPKRLDENSSSEEE